MLDKIVGILVSQFKIGILASLHNITVKLYPRSMSPALLYKPASTEMYLCYLMPAIYKAQLTNQHVVSLLFLDFNKFTQPIKTLQQIVKLRQQ